MPVETRALTLVVNEVPFRLAVNEVLPILMVSEILPLNGRSVEQTAFRLLVSGRRTLFYIGGNWEKGPITVVDIREKYPLHWWSEEKRPPLQMAKKTTDVSSHLLESQKLLITHPLSRGTLELLRTLVENG